MTIDKQFDLRKMIDVDLPRCSNYFRYDSKKGMWVGDDTGYESYRNKILNTPLP